MLALFLAIHLCVIPTWCNGFWYRHISNSSGLLNLTSPHSSVSAHTQQRSQGSVDSSNHRSSLTPSRIAIASDVNFQYPPINAHHNTHNTQVQFLLTTVEPNITNHENETSWRENVVYNEMAMLSRTFHQFQKQFQSRTGERFAWLRIAVSFFF